MNGKYLVFGDIHGDIRSLKYIMSRYDNDRTIVFLGDYINRGTNSKLVIEYLLALETNKKCIFIRGNHDVAFENYIRSGDFPTFARYGGINTIKSYVKIAKDDVHQQFIDSIPNEHLLFFKRLIDYYEDKDYFFSHSGINIKQPYSRSMKDLINNGSLKDQLNDRSLNKVKVFGHFCSVNGAIVDDYNICIDTGSGSNNGYLSAILLPERKTLNAPNN